MKILNILLLLFSVLILNQETESEDDQMAQGLQFFQDMLAQYVENDKLNVAAAIEGVEVIEAEEKAEVKAQFDNLETKEFTPQTFTDELIKQYSEKQSGEEEDDDEPEEAEELKTDV